MPELSEKFKDIIKDIEKNIKNKDDLEYIKTQIYNISSIFLEQLDKVVELTSYRMEELVKKQSELNSKMSKIEGVVGNIEKDIYLDEEDNDFEIICPYCNNEFMVDFNTELKNEVRCPECNNIIELDWNEEEEHSCSGNCHCCDSGCEENNEDIQNNNEDDK